MSETPAAAFYARSGSRAADWLTILHPPYTAWHLAYVAIGAGLAPHIDWAVCWLSLAGFLLAVGVAAHALDEWNGRPLGTRISDGALWTAAILSLAGAAALGISVLRHTGLVLIPFIVVGAVLVLGYNLELFGGVLHTDLGFALAWGGFPAAVGYVAQAPPWTVAGTFALILVVLAATALSAAQRRLSTPARALRRYAIEVEGNIEFTDERSQRIDRDVLLAPLDGALKLLSLAVPAFAVALLLARWAG
ncbi:hypothetical protein [Actinospica sp.]|uniref:hypothetical protein n=1 Tax=Actinospica sp. TaxID=1872142 RepID=UPI002C7B8A9A|nr:hypothetical protein [Actinospica sp.]HWG27363.1 hypothetical protein [Actinospica sp.]